jgi:hypothetical protein
MQRLPSQLSVCRGFIELGIRYMRSIRAAGVFTHDNALPKSSKPRALQKRIANMHSYADSYSQAWKEGNDNVAQYMLQIITSTFLSLPAVPRGVPRPSDHLQQTTSNTWPICPRVTFVLDKFHLTSVTLMSRSRPQRELCWRLQIGRSLLISEGRDNDSKIDARAEEAVKWLQKAFSLAEHLDDKLTAGAVDLKVGFLFSADNVTA